MTETAPDVTIVKTVSPASANPGDAITYTLRFTNTGELVVTNVVITDSVPLSVTNPTVAGKSGAVITLIGTAPNFVWDVEDLSPDEGGVITLTGTLTEPLGAGVFTNIAQIACINNGDENNKTSKAGVTVTNVAPIADAGDDDSVAAGSAVQLDGSGSSDSNGDSLDYGWRQTGGSPAMSLSSATAISPTFTANSVGVFTFILTVTDTKDATGTDLVTITVELDSDGDGLSDSLEGYLADVDNDGIPDYLDDEVIIRIYLPIIAKNYQPLPDLVITDLSVAADAITVTV